MPGIPLESTSEAAAPGGLDGSGFICCFFYRFAAVFLTHFPPPGLGVASPVAEIPDNIGIVLTPNTISAERASALVAIY